MDQFGLGQTKKKKETEAKVRTTKATLKDVTITETVEGSVRGTSANARVDALDQFFDTLHHFSS